MQFSYNIQAFVRAIFKILLVSFVVTFVTACTVYSGFDEFTDSENKAEENKGAKNCRKVGGATMLIGNAFFPFLLNDESSCAVAGLLQAQAYNSPSLETQSRTYQLLVGSSGSIFLQGKITKATNATCISNPPLPSGLSFISLPYSCYITGTPTTGQPATNYTITTSNEFGSASTTISIEVIPLVSYDFETGVPSGWSGTWIPETNPENCFSGNCLQSPSVLSGGSASVSFSATIGQLYGTSSVNGYGSISFYWKGSCQFSIDGKFSSVSSSGAWALKTVGVPYPGYLTFTWTSPNSSSGSSSSDKCWIDSITIPGEGGRYIKYIGNPYKFTINTPIITQTPTISGVGTITNCTSSSALPTGLSLSPATCAISGTPTVEQAAKSYVIYFFENNISILTEISITVSAPGIAYTGSPYTFTNGIAIATQTPSFTGASLTNCTVSPTLPAGFSLSATTCAISGTPTVNQSATNYTITATHSSGTATATVSIAVVTPLSSIAYMNSPVTFTTGYSASATATVVGTISSCSVSPAALPTGLSISTSTCAMSGTPTATQSATNYTVTATNTLGSVNSTISIAVINAGTVSTLVGNAAANGYVDGTGTSALFKSPAGIAVDSSGNIYVADTTNHAIRKVTQAGVVTTLAGLTTGTSGSTDGTGTTASFSSPRGVAVDYSGNVYVADTSNYRIRKITSSGVVTTLAGSSTSGSADGTGTAARFNAPSGVAVDSTGNVYVADTSNNAIRKIASVGTVTTLAGLAGTSGTLDGTGTAARFNFPYGVAVDSSGSVYVTDYSNSLIRKVTSAGVVTTLANSTAGVSTPVGITLDSSGNLYIAQAYRVLKVFPSGSIITIAGLASSQGSTDGTGSIARFSSSLNGIGIDSSGNLYVGDSGNFNIRKIVQ